MYSRITLGAVCAAILVLPACGPSYQKKALPIINNQVTHFETVQDSITLKAKKIGIHEAPTYFSTKGRHLFTRRNPITPIHVSIMNNSFESIQIDPCDTTLVHADPTQVATALQHNAIAKTIGLAGIGALAIAASGFLAIGGFIIAAFTGKVFLFYLGTTLLVGSLVTTPTASVYFYNNWSQENTLIAQDISQKNRPDNQKIITLNPQETISYILFAQDPKQSCFDITVHKPQKDVTFNVQL